MRIFILSASIVGGLVFYINTQPQEVEFKETPLVGTEEIHEPVEAIKVSAKPTIKTEQTAESLYSDSRREIFDAINIERVKYGLLPLKRNERLDTSARNKTKAMIELNFIAHNDPDGSEFWHYFKDVGYKFNYAGENISWGFSEKEAVEKWLESPTHRANILNPLYNETGIYIEGSFIVQHFGNEMPRHTRF